MPELCDTRRSMPREAPRNPARLRTDLRGHAKPHEASRWSFGGWSCGPIGQRWREVFERLENTEVQYQAMDALKDQAPEPESARCSCDILRRGVGIAARRAQSVEIQWNIAFPFNTASMQHLMVSRLLASPLRRRRPDIVAQGLDFHVVGRSHATNPNLEECRLVVD